MMNAKLHRARVTEAELGYVGSLSVDASLLERAGILPNEQVAAYNVMTGARFETYAIEGSPGQVCLNGAVARLGQVGDLLIIVTFVDVEDGEAGGHRPTVLVLDEKNQPVLQP